MKSLIPLLLLASCVWAQTPAQTSVQGPVAGNAQAPSAPASSGYTNPAQPTPSLSFIAAGGAYNDATPSHFSAWGVAAFPLGKGFYNYNLYELIPVKGKPPVSSMTPGAAFQARCGTVSSYSVCLYMLGTIGVSTGSSATTLATTIGGAVVMQAKSGWGWLVAWLQQSSAGAKFPELLSGASYSFGGGK